MSNNLIDIRVIGVGGGGNNAIDHMIKEKVDKVSFIAINTDQQQLERSLADQKILLKSSVGSSRGLGAGANPIVGEKLASEAKAEIEQKLQGADLVIITAGMGGGTGTGGAHIVAEVAKQMGILTMGIITTPFTYEGKTRFSNAQLGIQNLNKHIDSLITISNEKLVARYGNRSLVDSFSHANDTLKTLVVTISSLINDSSLINVDFADVRTILKNKGAAMFGASKAYDDSNNGMIDAALDAVTVPLSEYTIKTAKSALVWIKGSSALTLDNADEIVQTIQMSAKANLNIIFGVTIDDNLGDEIQISVIATGIDPVSSSLSKTISFATKKKRK